MATFIVDDQASVRRRKGDLQKALERGGEKALWKSKGEKARRKEKKVDGEVACPVKLLIQSAIRISLDSYI